MNLFLSGRYFADGICPADIGAIVFYLRPDIKQNKLVFFDFAVVIYIVDCGRIFCRGNNRLVGMAMGACFYEIFCYIGIDLAFVRVFAELFPDGLQRLARHGYCRLDCLQFGLLLYLAQAGNLLANVNHLNFSVLG